MRVNAAAGDPALRHREGARRDRRRQPDRDGEGRAHVLGLAGAVHAGAHEPAHARSPATGSTWRPTSSRATSRRCCEDRGVARHRQSRPAASIERTPCNRNCRSITDNESHAARKASRPSKRRSRSTATGASSSSSTTRTARTRATSRSRRSSRRRGDQLHGALRPRPDLRADDGGAPRPAPHPDDGEPQRLALRHAVHGRRRGARRRHDRHLRRRPRAHGAGAHRPEDAARTTS